MKTNWNRPSLGCVVLSLAVVGLVPGCAGSNNNASSAVAKAGSGLHAGQTYVKPSAYAKPTARMPRAVTSFGAAATASALYVLGGYFGEAHRYNREGQSPAFERMDLASGKWETLASPGALQSATLTEYAGKLYRVGGLRIDNPEGKSADLHSVADVGRFDPALGTWEPLPALPVARSSHDAILVGSELYIVGGWQLDGSPRSGIWDDKLYVADLSQSPIRWRSIACPFRLRALGVAATGDRIVTVGGIGDSKASREVHVYDVRQGSWHAGPVFPDPGFGVRAVTLGKDVIASGQSGIVYWLRPDLSGWEPLTQLAFPRVFHQYVALNDGSALAVGGIVGMQRVDRIAHIETLSFNKRPDPVTRFELDAPGPVKNRQGIFLREQQLYLFGGNNSLGQHDFAAENFVSAGYHLDLGSLSFKDWVAFPVARQSVQTLDVGDQGYAVGGFGLDAGKQRSSAEVYRFDFENDAWSQTKHGLVEPRTQFGLTEYADKLWVFGGMDFDDSRGGSAMFAYPASVLVADVKNADAGFVDAGFSIPRPRRAFASARIDSKFYLVGGMEADFKPVPVSDVYDFETRAWSQIAAPPSARIGAEMVALGGKLYLTAGRVVGSEVEDADKRVEVFNPVTGVWKTWAQPLPIKDSHQLRLLSFGSRLLAYTAQREDSKIELLLLDPSAVDDN